ncbi:hypothetical protein [Photorhabdus caribbeanensis]|uniref:hypothetical protein n=1 Tax=Photorhabdus caribbeanensis TaxID=1004165 RepID=UPI003CCE61F4
MEVVTPGRGTPRLSSHIQSGLDTASFGNEPPEPLIGTPATFIGKIQLQQMSVINLPPITSAFWQPGSANADPTHRAALAVSKHRDFTIMVRSLQHSNVRSIYATTKLQAPTFFIG